MKPFQFSLRALVLGVLGVGVLIYVGAEIYDIYRDPRNVSETLRSRTDSEIIAEFGVPSSKSTFKLSTALAIPAYPHFHYTLNSPTDDPEILEVIWHRGRWVTMVWFASKNGSWHAIDGFEFHEGTKF